jgi:hypothetical protein
MTWRERIVAARARERRAPWWLGGFVVRPARFTADDHRAWLGVDTCLAGEVAESYGLDIVRGAELWHIGLRACNPLLVGDYREVERVLDAIEDRALALKREHASGASRPPRAPSTTE